ncbi:hypothetical protein FM037_22260 [Shewanella psychropiezotolerans]|uniref:Transcriptional regulator n=1 Tax=Shewanella psychropiezotolerans TaxID=2593655 RepID=A0ABX5X2B2_9GAMM|nr:hypothetical protein [Shewanella psychropiezotolerans]QDO85479.1 hypothetical protein FM037_22260 [Shewanella psychropiezotolerans]
MSNIIQLLERMGKDANLQSREMQLHTINTSNLEANIKEPLLKSDLIKLKKELDVCPDIFCVFFPAEDEPEKDSTEKESPKEDESELKSVVNA